MHIHADVIRAHEKRLARVQPHPHPHLDTLCPPGGSGESLLRLSGGRDRIPRAGKGDEERIPFGVDLVAVVPSEDLTEKLPVVLQHLGVGLCPEPLQQSRRPLDVAEQERDRPRGLCRHHGHMIDHTYTRHNSPRVGLLEIAADADQGTFLNCECAGVPSGAVVRLASVLFVCDSISE